MADHSLGALNHEREQIKRQLLEALSSMAGYANRVREDVEKDDRADWWADHSQGLGYSATRADRLLNRLVAFDRSIALVTEAKQYAKEAAETARASLRRLLDYAGPDEQTDFEEQDDLGQANHIWNDIAALNAWIAEEGR